jgi:hypothetical protein
VWKSIDPGLILDPKPGPLLRVFTAGRYEIKTIDLVFLVIPLIVVSLATGKIRGLDMFGVKADSLPVVDEQKRFAGTVVRSQPTAGLILAVSDKLEGR